MNIGNQVSPGQAVPPAAFSVGGRAKKKRSSQYQTLDLFAGLDASLDITIGALPVFEAPRALPSIEDIKLPVENKAKLVTAPISAPEVVPVESSVEALTAKAPFGLAAISSVSLSGKRSVEKVEAASSVDEKIVVSSSVIQPEVVSIEVVPSIEVDDSKAPVVSAVETEVSTEPIVPVKQSANYRLTDKDYPNSSLKVRCTDNINAVRAVLAMADSTSPVTKEDQSVIAKFSGWGGIPQVFGEKYTEWASHRAELKAILSKEQWASAMASTPNAHFTDFGVARFMWDALKKMGFKGGKVLEPAAGSGYFFGTMPETLSAVSKLYAVELEQMSARIAQALYPSAFVSNCGFEETKFENDSFDLVISNVPFGDYKVPDADYTKFKLPIHDYFIAKSVDKVRPGGVVAVITSSFSMDKLSGSARKYIAEKADLVAAVRLPNTAFQNVANTEVTTDILFFKKRMLTDEPNGIEWLKLDDHKVKGIGEPFRINEYFAANPEMMLGTMGLKSSQFGPKPTLLPDKEVKLKDALKKVTKALPSEVFSGDSVEEDYMQPLVAAPDYLKEGALTVSKGKLYRNILGNLQEVEKAAYMMSRAVALIPLRDKTRELLLLERTSDDDKRVEACRKEMNRIYDAYVKKFGYIHSRSSSLSFREDPDYVLLLSLEIYDDETKKATKADLFKKRLFYPTIRVDKADTAKDALLISLNERGRIDFERMAQLTGKSKGEISKELIGVIFKDPKTKDFVTADDYLSGNVRRKLEEAEDAAAQKNGVEYQVNVNALKAVQPEDLTWDQIGVGLGTPWLPSYTINDFMTHILKVKNPAKAFYLPAIGTWKLEMNNSGVQVKSEVMATQKWGTLRVNFFTLIEDALNRKIPTVKDLIKKGGQDKYVVNIIETASAREKLMAIKEEFKKWLWSDEYRRTSLTELYNKTINNLTEKKFDGSHLTFPGMNSAIRMLPHQKDAVWRQIVSGNSLLYHFVGSGKTFCSVAAIMEMRRMKMIGTAMLVIPNHLLQQWGAEFLRLYPHANILLAGSKNVSKSERKLFLARIVTGQWDAVIITQTAFERISMSKEFMREVLENEIDMITDAITATKAAAGEKGRSVKELEKQRFRLRVKLSERMSATKKDDGLHFEDLGIDLLTVDEADCYKNLYYFTKMTRVAGMSQSDANRSSDLYFKAIWLNNMRRSGDLRKKIVFLTGTAISNTIAECFTMQRYLQPEILQEYGLPVFDAWAGAFAEAVPMMEIAPDGSGYRMNTRLAKFVNIPELMKMFKMVADVQTESMVKLPKPAVKREVIQAPLTPALQQYIRTLVARAEALRQGGIDPTVDNMLCVTNDGRKAAMDMRLIDSNVYEDMVDTKVNMAVDNICRIWNETKDARLTQLVFCDMSAPYKGKFNVYEDMKAKLIAKGVDEYEIAFIHDANTDLRKYTLFQAVRRGKIRILFGSTSKMGVGTNVQDRIIAQHDLDCPWRPRDIEQRSGRSVRQGNLNPWVTLYRYVTTGSFDAYQWQVVENKAKFIEQIFTASSTVRVAQDVDNPLLTYQEIKALASGNPLVLEKFKVEAELGKLELLKHGYTQNKSQIRYDIGVLPTRIYTDKLALEKLESDLTLMPDSDKFSMVLEGETYYERKDAAPVLEKIASKYRGYDGMFEIGQYGEFTLHIRPLQRDILAKGAAWHTGTISPYGGMATIQSLDSQLRHLKDRIEYKRRDVETQKQRLIDLEIENEKDFEYEARLIELRAQLVSIDNELDLSRVDVVSANEVVAEENDEGLVVEIKEEVLDEDLVMA